MYVSQSTRMDSFRNTISSMRDVLRKMSIMDMNSMRVCSIYLTSRVITCDIAQKLNIPDKLCWESLYSLCENGNSEKSLELLKDELLPFLDMRFSIHKFQFDVSNSHNHREIMKILNRLDVEKTSESGDILGIMYELHLETSSGSGRDLGQFFTDRNVCKFIVNLVNPKLVKEGIPESVCDPTMGTGGFLNIYLQSFKDKNIDWSKQQQQIHGCDTDERVVGISNINMFLETGVPFKNLKKLDSIADELPMAQYDIMVGNPPFGVNASNKNANASIRSLNIPSEHSEPVFLQIFMSHLAPGGRCAVILPNGFFQNKYADHISTRKYLIENFNVKKIIRFNSNVKKGAKHGSVKNAKFFIGTGVQCSILYFENNGLTEKIQFYDLKKTDDGIDEPVLLMEVPRENIDRDYSLDVSKYIKHDKNLPTLEALCNYQNGRTIKGGNPNKGEYPIMGGGTSYNGLNTEFNREPNTISISKSGTAGYVHWHTQRFWAGDCFTISSKDTNILDNRYLYYYLDTHREMLIQRRTGSTVPHCKWDDIRTIPVEVPPLEKQMQIVKYMDEIYKVKKESEDFLENFKNKSKESFDSML